MAKNLIDDTTYEFTEGTSKDDLEILAATVQSLFTTLSDNLTALENRISTVESTVSSQGTSLSTLQSNLNTHTGNSNIHTTQAEKAYVAEPFVTGTYFGSGTLTRSFNLGFKPSLVILITNGKTIISPVTSSGSTSWDAVYSAIGAGQGSTHGLEITSNGFSIDDTTDSTNHIYCYLNESGAIYSYIAFKPR